MTLDQIKLDFFNQFLPSVPIEDIENWIIILPKKAEDSFEYRASWIVFDKYCTKPIGYNKNTALIY